jgi:hypothetical protein
VVQSRDGLRCTANGQDCRADRRCDVGTTSQHARTPPTENNVNGPVRTKRPGQQARACTFCSVNRLIFFRTTPAPLPTRSQHPLPVSVSQGGPVLDRSISYPCPRLTPSREAHKLFWKRGDRRNVPHYFALHLRENR